MAIMLKGGLASVSNLVGTLTEVSSLTGYINASSINDFENYNGEYTIVPASNDEQVLDTQNKVLRENIVVEKVPFYETSNLSNGVTAYIGKEV